MALAFNILSLMVFATFLGQLATQKVANQIEERVIREVWINISLLWPAPLLAILTFLLLRVLSDNFKKVFSALNFGLGLYTIYLLAALM